MAGIRRKKKNDVLKELALAYEERNTKTVFFSREVHGRPDLTKPYFIAYELRTEQRAKTELEVLEQLETVLAEELKKVMDTKHELLTEK